jgi:hypothetical protein
MRSATLALTITLILCLVCSAIATASSATTRAEFIRKGDALCAEVKRQLVPVVRRAKAAKTLPESQKWAAAADIWADQIRIQRRFVRRFHAIGLPANDAQARVLANGLDRGLTLAIRVQRAFAVRNEAAIPKALQDYVSFTLTLNARVRAYGFRICGL